MSIRLPRGVPLVLRWDLDKTYLRTEFDRMRDLIRLARETAEEKKVVPGATTLLRGLVADTPCRLTFVSGSPTQMREVLEEKLKLDGIEADRLILKPNLALMMKGRFRAIRGQVAYKLPVLLAQRAMVPRESPEVCFGDDAEADAFIYMLYGDVVAGNIDGERLRTILQSTGAYPDQIESTLAFASGVQARARKRDPVKRVFIHLDRKSEPNRFGVYGSRVIPISNYAQAAAVLHLDGVLSLDRTLAVFERLTLQLDVDTKRVVNALQALVRRQNVDRRQFLDFVEGWDNDRPQNLPRLRDALKKSILALKSDDDDPPKAARPSYEDLIAMGHLQRPRG